MNPVWTPNMILSLRNKIWPINCDRLTCEGSRGHQVGLAAARVHDVLLDQVASDLHHRVEGTLQDLLRPIADELARRLRHFLFVGLHQLSQLRLQRGTKVKQEPSERSSQENVTLCRKCVKSTSSSIVLNNHQHIFYYYLEKLQSKTLKFKIVLFTNNIFKILKQKIFGQLNV